jgi:hypothetical protein
MELLKSTADRKTWAYPKQRNTFGLSRGPLDEGGTCPGCTSGQGGCCERPNGRKTAVCYVDRLLHGRPTVRRALAYNTRLMFNATFDQKVYLLLREFTRFASDCSAKNVECNYRIHWAGDVFNEEYARALREAITACRFINFWGYTRNFDTLETFAGLPNLHWYLSLDAVNFDSGYPLYLKYRKAGNIHYGLMFRSIEERMKRCKDYRPCPVDTGRLPLVGACHKCRHCLTGKNVWFKTK